MFPFAEGAAGAFVVFGAGEVATRVVIDYRGNANKMSSLVAKAVTQVLRIDNARAA